MRNEQEESLSPTNVQKYLSRGQHLPANLIQSTPVVCVSWNSAPGPTVRWGLSIGVYAEKKPTNTGEGVEKG